MLVCVPMSLSNTSINTTAVAVGR